MSAIVPADSILGLLKDACNISYDKYIAALGIEAVEAYVGALFFGGGKFSRLFVRCTYCTSSTRDAVRCRCTEPL